MKSWGIRLFLLAAIIGLFTLSGVVFAADQTFERDLSMRIDEDGIGHITQTYTVTNSVSSELDKITIIVPAENISNLSVMTTAGTSLDFKTTPNVYEEFGRTVRYQEVEVDLPFFNFGAGSSLVFDVNYSTPNFTTPYGDSYLVSLSRFNEKFELADGSVTALLPLSFGSPHYLGLEADSTGIDGSFQEIVFSRFHTAQSGIGIGFGRTQLVEIEIDAVVKNDGWLPGTLSVVLPPDLHNQKSSLLSITPEPSSITLDVDGNILANYFLWPKQSKSVTATVVVEISFVRYGVGQIGAELSEQLDIYTQLEGQWVLEGLPASLAEQLEAREASEPVSKRIDTIAAAVRDALDFNPELGVSSRIAMSELARGSSVSGIVYADVLTTLLRNEGIPARVVLGSVDIAGVRTTSHAWVEAYAIDGGWRTVDVALDEILISSGVSSLNRLGYSALGVNSQAPINTEVTYSQKLSDNPEAFIIKDISEAKFSASKLMIIPGVSIVRSTAMLSEGVPQDNIGALVDGEVLVQYGSLAPLQKKTRWSWSFLGDAFSKSNVAFGYSSGESLVEPFIHETTASLNFLLFILELLVLGGLVAFMLKYRRKGQYKVFHVDSRRDSIEEMNMLKSAKAEQRDHDKTEAQ